MADSTILDWLERLLKVSGLLALFGNMSFRAHFNFLGISSVSTLGVEQYLMETYRFAAYLVSILGPTAALFILIISFLPDFCRRRAIAILASPRLSGRGAASLMLLVLLVFALRMLQLLSQYGTDVA